MPRADPTRSPYCASRHLLRNLDNAAELRRNPLVRACFAPDAARRDAGANRRALETVRGLVHASLVRFRDRPGNAAARGSLGRMHAALLRCEIDKQPLSVVSAELGLSDRQVRRERRAAHDAFLSAFDDVAFDAPPRAVVHDTATLRLAEASELHEVGQSALATTACEAIAAAAPDPQRRIEALCLAAEIDLDAARFGAAAARIDEAHAIAGLRADELTDAARIVTAERIDLVAWSMRRATGVSNSLGTAPPLAVVQANAGGERDEARRALLVRAFAAYAGQRYDVGDGIRMSESIRRAHELVPSLDPSRAKERLAVMFAEGLFHGLRALGADRDDFLAVEHIAKRRGYPRTWIAARAERIGTDLTFTNGCDRFLDAIVGPLEPNNRRTMPGVLANVALIASQCERDVERRISASLLAESLAPPRSATALFARALRARQLFAQNRYDEAWHLARTLHNDAELLGNGRVRGAAAADLAAIAFARRQRGEATRYIREALPLVDRYGTQKSIARAHALARKLRVD